MTEPFDSVKFSKRLIEQAEKERTVGENKPEQRSEQPRQKATGARGVLFFEGDITIEA